MKPKVPTVSTPLRGDDLLVHPMLNKSSAFDAGERRSLGLEGLLPEHVSTMEEQVERIRVNIERKRDALEQYIGLTALHDRNEHLFYRLLGDHLEQFAPIVYTPTVGLACQQFSHIFRRPRGLWITPAHRGRIAEILANAPEQDIRLIVATDNERILGLGDQGAGGMCIPIGKLVLYTVAAGIHPKHCLPISLDVGTDNETLLADPLYLGWRHERLRGERYDSLIEEFVQAVFDRFPTALLQWEDFKKDNALRLLARYRHRCLSFNDDVQGTGAVGLAGVLAACRTAALDLRGELHVVIAGAGAAGVGIARQLRHALRRAGVPESELPARIILSDSRGLLTVDRRLGPHDEYKRSFALPAEYMTQFGLADGTDLHEVVARVQPNALIGTTGQCGTFDEALIRTMARHAARPIIFPFSNPNSKAEAQPADLIEWTEGRALVATGSPFPAVEYSGRRIDIGQGNNVFIFPGVGLGALAVGAREVTGQMFTAAAETLARNVSDRSIARGMLYPRLSRLRAISSEIARAVATQAVRDGVTAIGQNGVDAAIGAMIWEPDYPRIVPGAP